jgi:outer membrane protein TolC
MISFNKRSAYTFFYFLLLLSNITYAQQKMYSLNELINNALQHYPLIQQDEAKIRTAQAVVTGTKHAYLPALRLNEQLNIGTDNSLAGGYLPIGNTPSVSGGIRNNNSAQTSAGNIAVLYSEYELLNFGLKKARINNANSFVHIESAGLEQDKYLLKQQVGILYFTLKKNIYQLTADSENIAHYTEIYKVIEALVKSGLKPGSDTSLAKAELSKAKATFNISVGNVQAVKQQLSYLTGVAVSSIYVDTVVVQDYQWKNKYQLPIDDSAQHPFVEYINQQKQFFTSNEKVIQKTYLPKVFIAGSAWARGSSIQYNDNFQSLGEGLGFQRYNYMAGVHVTYDLFNAIRQRDRLNINHYQIESIDKKITQEKLYLKNALSQADNSIAVSENNLTELPNQVMAATDVVQQKMAQYKAGLINLIDLTNAAYVLYRSKTDYIETLSNWYAAKLDKAAASGKLDEFINTLK